MKYDVDNIEAAVVISDVRGASVKFENSYFGGLFYAESTGRIEMNGCIVDTPGTGVVIRSVDELIATSCQHRSHAEPAPADSELLSLVLDYIDIPFELSPLAYAVCEVIYGNV